MKFHLIYQGIFIKLFAGSPTKKRRDLVRAFSEISSIFLMLLIGSSSRAIEVSPPVKNLLITTPSASEAMHSLNRNYDIQCSSIPDWEFPLSLPDAMMLTLCRNSEVRNAMAELSVEEGKTGESGAVEGILKKESRNQFKNKVRGVTSADSALAHQGSMGESDLIRQIKTESQNRDGVLLLNKAHSNYALIKRCVEKTMVAYFDAEGAMSQLRARSQDRASIEYLLTVVNRRQKEGAIGQTDLLQVKMALVQAELAEQKAETYWEKSVAAFGNALNISVAEPLQLKPITKDELGKFEDDLRQWIKSRKSDQPPVSSTNRQIGSASGLSEPLRSLRISSGTPSIDLGGTGLEVPGADLVIHPVADYLEEQEGKKNIEEAQAYADAMSAVESLRLSFELRESAKDALLSAQISYAKGAISIVQLLRQQIVFSDAIQKSIDCQERFRLAKLKLLGWDDVLTVRSLLDIAGFRG